MRSDYSLDVRSTDGRASGRRADFSKIATRSSMRADISVGGTLRRAVDATLLVVALPVRPQSDGIFILSVAQAAIFGVDGEVVLDGTPAKARESNFWEYF